MRNLSYSLTLACCLFTFGGFAQKQSKGWISLFDGKSLTDWKVGDNAGTFTVDSGMIIAHGNVAHLFYNGNVQNHDFKNFHFKAEVKTTPGSNSGIYFHTTYQESGWPSKGYEVQVNNSHTDWRRTGGLYAIQDVKEQLVKDNVWFTEEIIVQGKKVTIKVNGKTTVEYTEPDNVERPADMKGRVLSHGTFALQGHDPNSKVYYKNIQVQVLPETK
ncbi:glycosyl hydrolase [Niastella yeongjuensis]|uniref:Glycosyl hydrolase n=1 Tax=Niastella yeongjuensis TaxID=354355 RepID=A0A1V9F521_9BACT|nr:DUF1080 domain-containing protein [Niastella yeongjuensis]OQP53391.1 glycosyl hydrolase [Niastella yeongjuensis]SEP13443.1 protein of unknown function [Niastella yeongjuensis]